MMSSKTILTIVRSIALAGTIAVFVLGMWSLVIIQAIDSSRGQRVLATLHSDQAAEKPFWPQFIAAARQGTARVWVLVIASLISAFTTLTVIISNRYYWLRISPPGVLVLESASTISTITAFACALSLSLSLNVFTTSHTSDSPDLSFFAVLHPLSKSLTIISSTTLALLLATLTAHIASYLQRRTKEKDVRSFEPTVSALGMSHGFQALHPLPRTVRAPIPTAYDPYRAYQKGPGAVRPGDLASQPGLRIGQSASSKHVGFADEAAWISRKSDSRWSVSTASPRRVEGDIMRLLETRKTVDLKKSRRAVPVRPARPQSAVVWYRIEDVRAVR